jgi:hypothetical protein
MAKVSSRLGRQRWVPRAARFGEQWIGHSTAAYDRSMPTTKPRKRAPRATKPPARAAASPKTTRPDAAERREPERAKRAGSRIARKLDAQPDRIDIRDWFYQPALIALPDQLVNCDLVPEILDQGNEGACTGYALAAVINFHLARSSVARRVSPRMLYELARRYDEWPGERYEGSSARGAMQGWVAHGVCSAASWPSNRHTTKHLTPKVAHEARNTPGGAYYRVTHRNLRDMHAALAEVGILYVTLMVHEGWNDPGPSTLAIHYAHDGGDTRELRLPVIERKGRADDGHAIAIVGYTRAGFIVQNSWGPSWGKGGFAILPYEDYMLHATDVWVGQLGVPIELDNWTDLKGADVASGLQRAAGAIPLSEIRPYVIDLGNNGSLSRTGQYWTSEEDLERLFEHIIPEATQGWSRRRILLYLHGGLNDEAGVAQRIIAYKNVLLQNQVYPVHIMWESGVWESLGGLIADYFTDIDERAGGVGDWLHKLRDGLLEAKDRSLELTAALPGGQLWREMKENARLASSHPDRVGGMQLIARYAQRALAKLSRAERAGWELHVVGHSAGAVFIAHAMRHLVALGIPLRTLQFMAPALTVADFKRLLLPFITRKQCPAPSLYLLSDQGELDDQVGPYGKSLLYLVSNAFEAQRKTPLLGMARYVHQDAAGATRDVDPELRKLVSTTVDGYPSLVVAGGRGAAGSVSQSNTHGGFDNDCATMNSVLHRILGKAPTPAFVLRDLQYEAGRTAWVRPSRGG